MVAGGISNLLNLLFSVSPLRYVYASYVANITIFCIDALEVHQGSVNLGRNSSGCSHDHQRGHVVRATLGLALRAVGQRTQHHRFSLLSLCSVSQWSRRSTALTKLHKAVASRSWLV